MGDKPIYLIYDIEIGQNKIISKYGTGTDTQQSAWLL